MTEAEWQVIRVVLPVSAWLEWRGGRLKGFRHSSQMIDVACYVADNGVKWANLPADESMLCIFLRAARNRPNIPRHLRSVH